MAKSPNTSKRILVNGSQMNLLMEHVLSESLSDKVDLVKGFLDKNFDKKTMSDKNGNVSKVFVRVVNRVPSGRPMWKEDVYDYLEREFETIFTDDKTREGFLRQVLNDWSDDRITKYGTLSSYSW